MLLAERVVQVHIAILETLNTTYDRRSLIRTDVETCMI